MNGATQTVGTGSHFTNQTANSNDLGRRYEGQRSNVHCVVGEKSHDSGIQTCGIGYKGGEMTWLRSRRCLLFLVVLLFFSSAISAEVCLTEDCAGITIAEAAELDQILLELAERSVQRQAELVTLGQSLQTSVGKLQRTQILLLTSEQALELAQSSYKEDVTYWRQRERELKITTVLASIAAAAVGFLAGWIAGR